ncbi:hypothetical protein D3C73_830660 [compost metagenome]
MENWTPLAESVSREDQGCCRESASRQHLRTIRKKIDYNEAEVIADLVVTASAAYATYEC